MILILWEDYITKFRLEEKMLESLDILENLVHRNTMIGVLCSQKYYLFNFVNSYYDFYGE